MKYVGFKTLRGYNTKPDQTPIYFLFQIKVEFWVLTPQCKQSSIKLEKNGEKKSSSSYLPLYAKHHHRNSWLGSTQGAELSGQVKNRKETSGWDEGHPHAIHEHVITEQLRNKIAIHYTENYNPTNQTRQKLYGKSCMLLKTIPLQWLTLQFSYFSFKVALRTICIRNNQSLLMLSIP